ncbi:hypothetical protein [Archangium violaceum]|uniref:hypothetical protein n=1 Tax=Archangium violaceum TaxID=83451 RepID=UPI0036DB69F4
MGELECARLTVIKRDRGKAFAEPGSRWFLMRSTSSADAFLPNAASSPAREERRVGRTRAQRQHAHAALAVFGPERFAERQHDYSTTTGTLILSYIVAMQALKPSQTSTPMFPLPYSLRMY